MRLTRPLAIVAETTNPCARPSTLYSAAYLAAPVTLARPSMREVGLPRWLVAVMAPSCLLSGACSYRRTGSHPGSRPGQASPEHALSDPFVGLRLRGPARRL